MPDTAPAPLHRDIEPAGPEPTLALNTLFLGGLFLLAALAAAYAAAEIILPVVLAFVLNAVFLPVHRMLQRFGLPRAISALGIVLALVALFFVIGVLLAGPLATWLGQLPETIPRIQERLNFLNAPIAAMERALAHIQALAPGSEKPSIAVETTSLAQLVLQQLQLIGEGAFTTLLILFFFLISGETFLRRLVELLPDFGAKRQAVEISQKIEQDISLYLATITTMNICVGIASGAMAWLTGLGDPLLWGMVAFVLNYVPFLGPAAGIILFTIAGLVTIDPLWAAFLPVALYMLIQAAEGGAITPMRLATRFTVNPVLVVLGVIFWYWMWGVIGAVLATPMLAITKIVCDRIDRLKPVGHFIGG
jgi:predicted PurR-regulated permease PerM